MNDFLRMCFNIITQIGPYLVVLLLLKYLVNLQQKRAKEREEEQKKGIIRTHYIIKTEKVLTMFFVLAVFLFGGATVASAIQQDDLLPPIGFSIFFIVSCFLVEYITADAFDLFITFSISFSGSSLSTGTAIPTPQSIAIYDTYQ